MTKGPTYQEAAAAFSPAGSPDSRGRIILAVAERIAARYPDPEEMAGALVEYLIIKSANIRNPEVALAFLYSVAKRRALKLVTRQRSHHEHAKAHVKTLPIVAGADAIPLTEIDLPERREDEMLPAYLSRVRRHAEKLPAWPTRRKVLTTADRLQIVAMRRQGLSYRAIAKRMGCSHMAAAKVYKTTVN